MWVCLSWQKGSRGWFATCANGERGNNGWDHQKMIFSSADEPMTRVWKLYFTKIHNSKKNTPNQSLLQDLRWQFQVVGVSWRVYVCVWNMVYSVWYTVYVNCLWQIVWFLVFIWGVACMLCMACMVYGIRLLGVILTSGEPGGARHGPGHLPPVSFFQLLIKKKISQLGRSNKVHTHLFFSLGIFCLKNVSSRGRPERPEAPDQRRH